MSLMSTKRYVGAVAVAEAGLVGLAGGAPVALSQPESACKSTASGRKALACTVWA